MFYSNIEHELIHRTINGKTFTGIMLYSDNSDAFLEVKADLKDVLYAGLHPDLSVDRINSRPRIIIETHERTEENTYLLLTTDNGSQKRGGEFFSLASSKSPVWLRQTETIPTSDLNGATKPYTTILVQAQKGDVFYLNPDYLDPNTGRHDRGIFYVVEESGSVVAIDQFLLPNYYDEIIKQKPPFTIEYSHGCPFLKKNEWDPMKILS